MYENLITLENKMKIDHSLKSKLEKYSIDGLKNHLDLLDNDELMSILNYLNKNINLINQFPNNKILKFRNFLKKYYSDRGIKIQYFKNIELIEDLYKEILDQKDKLIFNNKIDLIQNLFQFTKEKNNILSKLIEMDLEEDSILNEELLKMESIDNEIEALCKIINYNLQSMSHIKSELVNEKNEIILPCEILEDKKYEDFSLDEYLLNTGIWDIVQDIDYNFKFFNNSLNKNILNEKNEIFLKTSSLHEYALISRQRMMMIHTDTILNQHKVFGKLLKDMEPTKREYLFLQDIFYRLYFINIENDNSHYNGLTIKEWFFSFLSLREASAVYKFNSISSEEIEKYFIKNGIHTSKHLHIINSLTYKKEKRADLYDTPLIKISDGSYLIFPLSIKTSNLEKVLFSIFSKLEMQITDKGKIFEKEVIRSLKRIENEGKFFKTSEINFSVKGEEKPQYQYDAILEWDDYIFIIECKNRSIATTESISLNQFEKKIDDYITQVNRLECGLIKNTNKHNINIKGKNIIKVVLNSLPFALDYAIENTYLIDYSSFLRFFSSKQICLEKISPQNHPKTPVYTLWTGSKPTVQDFIDYLNYPPQVIYLKNKVKPYETSHNLLEYIIKVQRYS